MRLSDHISKLKSEERYCYTYVIAEVGINHDGFLDEALRLVDAAHACGVDAVKFQKRNLEELYTKTILDRPNSAEWTFDYLIPILKEVELSHADYRRIKDKCDHLGLDLIITPFDISSVRFAGQLGVSGFKIASADLVNGALIRECATFGLPLIISTGMWSGDQVQKAVTTVRRTIDVDFFLLLANSTYPTPYESINLGFITRLAEMHEFVGYSGHERGTFIPIAAAALGARIVEKHITFDRHATGPDHKASMLPSEFMEMTRQLRLLELAMGVEKTVNQAEKLAKEAFAKSPYAIKKLAKGHKILVEDFVFQSPGKGLDLQEFDELLGHRLTRDIWEGELLSREHLSADAKGGEDWDIPKFTRNWGIKCRFHDFEEYQKLQSPVIEFHCSEADLDIDFQGGSKDSQLVIHAPEIFGRTLVDLCSEDKNVVKGSLEVLQRALDKTASLYKNFPLHRPKFVVHLGGMTLDHAAHDVPTQLMMDRATENFKQLIFSDEIEILPENLPPRPWYLGGQWFQYGFMEPEDMVKFCQHFGFDMTFDICHASLFCNARQTPLIDYARRVLPHTSHLHISDAIGIDGEGIQIEEGQINFAEVLEEVGRSQKTLSWVTEIWSGHLNNGSGCRQSMHRLGKYKNHI